MLNLENLKVSFIAGTLGKGGAERQLYHILNALVESGARPSLFCLTRGEFWEDKIKELGVPVTWVGQHRAKPMRLLRLIAELRKNPPDILQSQHFYTNLYAVGAARFLGLNEVGAIRCDTKNEVRDGGPVFGPLSLRTPRVIAANSRAGIKKAEEMGIPAKRLRLLPNVIDATQFESPTRNSGNPIRIVGVGRLVEQKKFQHFLNVIARLQAVSATDIRVKIVGDGPLRPQLEKRAVELGLKRETLRFAGALLDMSAVYREADIFLLTSAWEGTPNVVLEAMASGLPVVATRVGGVSEIISHGETGFLLDVGDENAMAETLLQLINDPQLRATIGDNARQYVHCNHSVTQLPVYLREIYELTLS
jgi:glycosyltransferase involved in cell wall biosynthesis